MKKVCKQKPYAAHGDRTYEIIEANGTYLFGNHVILLVDGRLENVPLDMIYDIEDVYDA